MGRARSRGIDRLVGHSPLRAFALAFALDLAAVLVMAVAARAVFAQIGDPEFAPRHGLDSATLLELFAWSEAQFNDRLAGNPIRRIGHVRWLRNIAVALGNGPATDAALTALHGRANDDSALVREHVSWAIARLQQAVAAPR